MTHLRHPEWATSVRRALAETTTGGTTRALDRLVRRCQRDEIGEWHRCETLWLKALVQLEAGQTSAAEDTVTRLLKLLGRRSRWPVVPDCNVCTTDGEHQYQGFGAVVRQLAVADSGDGAARALPVAMALASASVRRSREKPQKFNA